DDPSRLRSRRARAHRPGPHFLRTRGEKCLQPEQLVARTDHAIQPRLLQAQLLEEVRTVGLLELRDFCLDRCAHRYDDRALALRSFLDSGEIRIDRKSTRLNSSH